MKVIKELGDYQYGDTVLTGILASATGNYTIVYEQFGVKHSTISAFTAGDELSFTNNLNEQAVCKLMFLLPVAATDTDINWVTTPHGEIIFEYRNVL